MDQTLKLLIGEALPDGAPKPELTQTQHIEVYGLETFRAVIVVETKNDKHVIKTSWLSSQDADLARQLMTNVRDRYLIPGKGLLFHVDASQPAILDEVKEYPLRSQIMSKTVDVEVEVPEDISYRDMTADEARDYYSVQEEGFVQTMLAIKSKNDRDEDVTERTRAMLRNVAPNGADTTGHHFIVVEDAGTSVATLWIAARSGQQCFCLNIEVDSNKRRLGYGRKTLLVWEHVAAKLGLKMLGLNVFGTNKEALKLYAAGGFRVEDATYTLDG